MTSYLQFLPLFGWAIFSFGVLYSLLESEFRPLSVVKASIIAATGILARHWRITATMFVLFAGAPAVEALSLFVLKLEGRPLLLMALCWQGITAAGIAWTATYIHGYALTLPKRNAREQLRYRLASLVAGVTLFLFGFALSSVLPRALQMLEFPPGFPVEYLAQLMRALILVPMALVRPALSLGLRRPVRAAILAAALPPFVVAVWVMALGMPSFAFNWFGVEIVQAHPSQASILAVQAANVIFNVFDWTFFETATLLLLARKRNRLCFGVQN